tara:strand:- start:254 stop:1528 length:1275 start_codon:yes stop_codon:yes gene_type:complete
MFKKTKITTIFKSKLFKLLPLGLFTFCLFETSQILKANDSENLPITLEYLKQKPDSEYILGPGDMILISLNKQSPELTNIYTIDVGGTITLPNIDRVYIAGLTTIELTNLLNQSYSEILIKPEAEIYVLNYRAVNVFVDGEVNYPGMYILDSSNISNNNSEKLRTFSQESFSLENINRFSDPEGSMNNLNRPLNITEPNNSINMRSSISEKGYLSNPGNAYPTVFDAIKAAGGITNYSDLSSIEIIRKNSISNGGGKIKTNVNFIELLNNGNVNQNIRILDGDVIRIKKSENQITNELLRAVKSNLNPQFLNVYVLGRVNNPGLVVASNNSTLNDSINLAGGAKFLKGKINFMRYNSDGTIEKRKFRYRPNAQRGSLKNPILKNGDIVYIGKNGINILNEVLTEVTSPFLGIYTTTKVIEDLSE